MKKDALDTFRNPMVLRLRLVTTIFMAIYGSGLYFQFTGEYTSRNNWRALTGFFFFMTVSTMMNALNPVQLVFPLQRAVFLK